ncbi:energy transducer TonB [Vibrio hippocampi]|uniref:TonB C-terminal domain-containing protein n=1 Tax=Vibrio hippocampi TaxID=654686 RepID=A0ABM8ZNU5_9VIBR|nr:energy transducer TonB [Vibrio hippocampi]CAH0530201.1 hypothetical protein VHP8226_03896 [Vibrio hippocampi]
MNVARYAVAGAISVGLHLAFMLANETKPVFAMPAGSTSTSVSLSFVAPTPKAQAQEPIKEPAPEPVKPETSQPQEVVETKKQIVEPTPTPPKPVEKTVKKPVEKKVPKKKTTKPKPKKPVEPKPVAQQKQKKPKPPETSPKPPEPKENTTEPTPEETPQIVNSGVSSKPIVVEKPSFLSKPVSPRYPRIARKRGIEGTATYEIWINAQGQQTQHILISSSGAEILDKSALDAIKQWKFSTHKIDGVAIAHRIRIPVRFNLD